MLNYEIYQRDKSLFDPGCANFSVSGLYRAVAPYSKKVGSTRRADLILGRKEGTFLTGSTGWTGWTGWGTGPCALCGKNQQSSMPGRVFQSLERKRAVFPMIGRFLGDFSNDWKTCFVLAGGAVLISMGGSTDLQDLVRLAWRDNSGPAVKARESRPHLAGLMR